MPGLWSRIRGQSEGTQVSSETEVRIPWQTYVRDSLRASIFMSGAWVIGWLVWAYRASESMTFWRWLTKHWLPWMNRGWYWVVITLVLCWIGLTNLAYSYRLKIEQIIKNPPLYGEWDPANGFWHPFIRRLIGPPKLSLNLKFKDLLDALNLELLDEEDEDADELE